jgi:hypothetical protein
LDGRSWVLNRLNAFGYAFVVDGRGVRVGGRRRVNILEVRAREVGEDIGEVCRGYGVRRCGGAMGLGWETGRVSGDVSD